MHYRCQTQLLGSYRFIVKTLLVLRHAKSSWKDQERSDHDRPLSKRGQRDAPRMGQLIAERRVLPDVIVSSTAKRANRTTEAVVGEIEETVSVQHDRRLYLANSAEVVDVLRDIGGCSRCVMVVGHNPGLENLVTRLTGIAESLPTAALAEIQLPIRSWKTLTLTSAGQLNGIWCPRELD